MTVPGRNDENQQHEAEEPRVVVRDRRKIDPETGELRSPDTEAAPLSGEQAGEPGVHALGEQPPNPVDHDLRAKLEETTADLQRVHAEYANYRKRTERERDQAAANAKAGLVADLLVVLDDADRAEAHGDLTGAFKAVADKLVSALQQAGLEPFGHEGDPFDPNVHEAVQHDTSPEVAGPTVTAVLRRGYRIGEKVVRPAMVAVTDHEQVTEVSGTAGVEEEPAAVGHTEPQSGEDR